MHRFMPLLIVGLLIAAVSGSFDGVLYPSDTTTQQPEQRPVNERESVRYRTETQTGQTGLNVNPMFAQSLTQSSPSSLSNPTQDAIASGIAPDRTARITIDGDNGEQLRIWAAYNEPNGTDTPDTFTPDGSLVCSDQNCTVNIRSRPHTNAAIACSGPNGTPGKQIRSAVDWLNVDFGDCVGWVHSHFYQHQ